MSEHNGEASVPDFILYFEDNTSKYELFIEPKGEHLQLNNGWKQDLLTSLRDDNTVHRLFKDQGIKISGARVLQS